MGAIQNIVNELRRRGVTVHEWSGWQSRGNGGVKDLDVRGIILHHTGSAYGSAYQELVSSSQSWANGGALCNFSGNSDGSLTVIAAGLTYHAGGGYGPNQGPLAPYADNRNYYTVGLEIVYPGSKPMTQQQYETAVTLSRVVVDLHAYGNAEYVRAHAEVNGRGYQGKWDPGSGVGTEHIDMTAFRKAVRNWSEQDMTPAQDAALSELWKTLVSGDKRDARFNEDLGYVLDQLTNRIQDLEDVIQTGNVDYDLLAQKVVTKMLTQIDVDLVPRSS